MIVASHILVLLDIREGIVEKLEIYKGKSIHFNIPDYEGVPFICIRCHKHGHIMVYFPLSFIRKMGFKNVQFRKI